MLPSIHILVSFVVVGLLFPFYSYWSFAFLIGSVLVDVDHYIWYVFRFKDLSLKRAYIYSLPKTKREKDILHVFHVLEFWVLMVPLALLNTFFALVFLGLLFHLVMDFIDLNLRMEGIDNRAFSFFMWLRRH